MTAVALTVGRCPMADDAADPVTKFWSNLKDVADRHRERAFKYEEKAIEFANNGFRTLSYPNGGALVAIPAVVALFNTDLEKVKGLLIQSALLFIVWLIFVVAAQAAAFVTMVRRRPLGRTRTPCQKGSHLFAEGATRPSGSHLLRRMTTAHSRARPLCP